MILGDPGSGKTTLLRFLALIGRSEALQRRYRTPFRYEDDERLPILVTLRRYADALKKDDNLSLFDYIRANIAADFSIADLSPEFLEYHLESGLAILLFDGLDELPNPEFKRKVRNRVQNLAEGYPGNCLLVTSRIYGYDGSFRFDVWCATLTAFTNGAADDQAVWRAASRLILDGALYMLGFHQPDEAWLREMDYRDDMIAAHRATAAETQSLFAELAKQTRDRAEPALRIAHCIRDLAYGDESRSNDLKATVESDAPEYHRIFVDCYWLPTEDERAREEEEDRRPSKGKPRG